MPVLRGLTELEAQALGLPAGSCEITSAGVKTPTSYSPGRWRGAKTYLLPPDPAQPGKVRHQMRVERDVHYQDDGGNWRTIDLDWRADPANPGEFVTDRNDIYTRVTRFGVAVWDRKRKVGVRWSTTARPATSGRRASFPKDGLEWTWSTTTSGLKLESEPVTVPRGPRTYEWRYLIVDLNTTDGFDLTGTLVPDATGNLVRDGIVTPLAFAVGKNGVRYNCAKWQTVAGKTRAVAFDFDDSALPPEAYPYTIDPTTTFASTVSADDAWLFKTSTTWLPTGATTVNTAQVNLAIQHSLFAPDYYRSVGVVKWDTTSIPDTATINSASFQGYIDIIDNANGMSICAEWYDPGTIDATDYTETIASTALAPQTIASMGAGGAKTLALTNVSSVNKTGYTGLRWHLNNTTAPTGVNRIAWASFDGATVANRPTLIIDYTDGAAPVPLSLGTATIAGVSSITATLSTQTPPVALNLGPVTIAGTSTVTAALVVKAPLSASISGTSTLSASPIVMVGLSAAISATSSLSAGVVVLTPLGPVSIAGTSALTAGLGIITPLSATITGTFGLTATLAVLTALQAAITGASTITAALATVGVMNPVALAATITATSTMSADPIIRRGLSAQIAGDSTIAATIAARLGLSAQIDGLSAITATLAVVGSNIPVALSATIAATSGLTADPVVLRGLTAQISGVSAITADLAAKLGLSASIDGTSAITATAVVLTPLSAAITAQGSIDAALAARVALAGAIAGTSAITAALSVVGTLNPVALSAVITATSGLTAELVVRRGMTAQVTATATITATLAVFAPGDVKLYLLRMTQLPPRLKVRELPQKWVVRALTLYTNYRVTETRELSIQITPGRKDVTLPTAGVTATWRLLQDDALLSNGPAVVTYEASAITITAVAGFTVRARCQLEYTVNGLGNEILKPFLDLDVRP